MIQEITSPEHKLVKKIASLKEKKYREKYSEFLVEGVLSVTWALSSSYPVSDVVISAGFTLPESLKNLLIGRTITQVPENLFAKMADTKTPQGILCTCPLPETPEMPEEGLFVYCDRVRDPGNLGTIIRTADAMGLSGVLLSSDAVDPFNPKLVRSTMGSLFHVPLFRNISYEALSEWKNCGFKLAVSALAEKAVSPGKWQADGRTIIVMGNEASGVSEEVLSLADSVIKIPMVGSAESLNVAAAAAILFYEAAKQTGRIKES